MNIVESLRLFRRVAESKSFSQVARENDITQPTVSKSIAALEKNLGLTLLRRTTRGLSLTIEGQKLYNSSGGLLDHFDRVLSEVTNQKLTLQGELRITASLAFARLILCPQLAEFSSLHTDLKLNLLLSDGYVDLIQNNIDAAVRIGELADSSLKVMSIGTSRRAIYVSKKYIKKFGQPERIGDLIGHRLLYYTRLEERASWPLLNASGGSMKFDFDPALKTDASDFMREAVISGLGIALLPTWMMIEPEAKGSVIRLFEEHSPRPHPIQIVTPAARELTQKQRVFIDFLRSKLDQISELSIRGLR